MKSTRVLWPLWAMISAFILTIGCAPGDTDTTTGAGGVAMTIGGAGGGGSDATGGAPIGGGGGDTGGQAIVPTAIPSYPFTAAKIAAGLAAGDCGVIAPGATEDNSYARVAMRVLAGTYSTMRFAALRSPSTSAPNPWAVGWIHVPAALDPANADCTTQNIEQALSEVDAAESQDAAGNPIEIVVYEWGATPSDSADGDQEVACLRMNTDFEGAGTPSVLITCGKGGLPDRDQWQDSAADGGAIHTMASYGYKGTWMVTVD